MAHPAKKESGKKYTRQDYLTWPDDERWEIIDGTAYGMTPSPNFTHQRIVINFGGILREKLKGKPCIAAIAPLDVCLDEFNIVQPDVMVICDKAKIRDNIYGAPDMAIEVLSPSTSLKDKRTKKSLYERFGVKEYVLIHPEEMLVERYCLKDGRYAEADVFGPHESLSLCSVEGVDVALWEIFEVEPSA